MSKYDYLNEIYVGDEPAGMYVATIKEIIKSGKNDKGKTFFIVSWLVYIDDQRALETQFVEIPSEASTPYITKIYNKFLLDLGVDADNITDAVGSKFQIEISYNGKYKNINIDAGIS